MNFRPAGMKLTAAPPTTPSATGSFRPTAYRGLDVHRQQCKVSAAAPDRIRVESERKNRFSRRLWDVQRASGCAGISHRSERPFQSDLQHRGVARFRPSHRSTAPVPAKALLVPGGVQPDMKTPTLISWSLRVQQEISPNTVLTVGYVGSHGYHEIIGIDANEPFPTICPASPCPATYPSTFPGPLANAPFPPGATTFPPKHQRRIPHWRIRGRGFRREQQLQRAASRREPSFQPWRLFSRSLHLVKSPG